MKIVLVKMLQKLMMIQAKVGMAQKQMMKLLNGKRKQ